jgi:cell division protein YceG involved in septum cleavage
MKKEIKKLIILTIFLTIISTIVILWKGREYELSFFNVKDDNYTISIENGDGSVEISKKK